MANIPVFKPLILDEEINAASESLKLGWLGPGSYVKEFEEKIKTCLGLTHQHVVAVNTGTSAVHLALKLCGVQAGDEVITPSLNNIADFQCIKALGASPVFCDIQEETLTIAASTIGPLISEKTKAIICLDYGSALCDYYSVKEIADKYSIPVIHDAAHAFGSSLNGRKVGSYSEICTFSFDPVKNITCIDGGAVIVGSDEQAEKIKYMRLLGQKQNQLVLYQNRRSWTYDVDDIGYRYHLANLHGAIGIEQIKKLDFIGYQRREIFSFYNAELRDIPGLKLPSLLSNEIIPFIYVVRVLNSKRELFREYLRQYGVDTGIHWQAGHKFTYFSNERRGKLDVTEKVCEEIVTLPLYPQLTNEEREHIVRTIKLFLRHN